MALTMDGGVKIPLVGLGTWQATDEAALETALNAALEIGYRHIDTAAIYGNEHIIGKVLKQWFDAGKLKREDIFITTKLSSFSLHPDLIEDALKESLKKLQLDYVDLYLIHFAIYLKGASGNMEPLPTDHLACWKKMEEQVDAKRARTIGVSNFSIKQIDRLVKNSRIKPANVQVEIQLYFQQKSLVKYCRENNIVVVSYSTLGSPGAGVAFQNRGGIELPNLLQDPIVTKIAEKHNKSTAQIMLRYFTQKNIVVIPKSINPKRLKENFNVLDFSLDSEDIKELESLDKDEKGRIFNFGFRTPAILEHPEYPF